MKVLFAVLLEKKDLFERRLMNTLRKKKKKKNSDTFDFGKTLLDYRKQPFADVLQNRP